ncbi:hypothetical protein SAMN04488074_105378 [Lentzea albidocapillata subsp. violacea]|uniref:Ig-like domain-containing protein n=1 Tax=Lentzea albidocapillata subsp. violacea TaxID=128104 RepID=A0A1G9BNH2_9PSEU|nr:hypothetical protein [Lentzea albidocapillata]SDK40953.1 hypothetical protein SAMN04488074_105378 [Lentzea albidocapillata subsp. violacea]
MRTASADLHAVRTITVDGSDVYLRVTASPVDLRIRWSRDGDHRVAGSPVLFPAGDRSRRLLGTNFRAGTTFCLDVVGEARQDWRGVVDWNV